MGDWPDMQEVRRARREEVEATTPVPERIWALRNAAAALALTGVPVKAREMMENAVQLKDDWVDDPVSPRLLGELQVRAPGCAAHQTMATA